jgi:acetyl esterase
MPLDSAIAAYLQRQKGQPPRSWLTIPETRQRMRQGLALAGVPMPVAEVTERRIPVDGGKTIALRLYRPIASRPLPCLVFFHGGRFISGDLDTHDPACRALAYRSGWAVLAVDYRLAPEHRFPTALEDCYAAFAWAQEQALFLGFDPNRIAVGGDSAGGNLAAAVCLLARERAERPLPCAQVLVYPMLDATGSSASFRKFASGYGPGAEDMLRGWELYLGEGRTDPRTPLASPFWAEHLSGLPPAMIMTAEYDTLRDEANSYARRLQEAGVAVEHQEVRGIIHGVLTFAGVLASGATLIAVVAAEMRRL